ncbi:hypothetical protein Acr_25g0011120 [Actinidia rufa]|uniref:Uncharacterized protein n=1 Tax=Actinidia rufa TaxID=165716 RepID=A0A7J0H0T4_9ERIC|nr:hypothetical protein Acr_25g0011120 [Actinidia rufa]
MWPLETCFIMPHKHSSLFSRAHVPQLVRSHDGRTLMRRSKKLAPNERALFYFGNKGLPRVNGLLTS